MKSILSVLLLSLGLVMHASAQEVYSSSGKPVKAIKKEKEKEEKKFANRILFGGGFGLGIGTVTNISVSPVVGYAITDKLYAGIGLGYQYFRIKDYFTLEDPTTHETVYKPRSANVYSPSVWARYIVWRNFFVHAEYEHNFLTDKWYYSNTTSGKIESTTSQMNVGSLLVGAGIRMPVSDKVSFVLIGLYDVLQNPGNPYGRSINIRFGINAGF